MAELLKLVTCVERCFTEYNGGNGGIVKGNHGILNRYQGIVSGYHGNH